MNIRLQLAVFKISFSLIVLFVSTTAYTQTSTFDSLQNVLAKQQKQDTNRVNTLINIVGDLNYHNNGKKTIPYLKEIVPLSEKLKFAKGVSIGSRELAIIYYDQSDYAESINYSYKALNSYREKKDSLRISEILQFLGANQFIIGDTTEALNNLLEALKIRQLIHYKAGVSQTYNSIGEIYCKQGRYAEALEKHIAAMNITQETGFKGIGWEKAYTYQCIGNVYEKQGDEAKLKGDMELNTQLFKKALEKYEECYRLWYPVQTLNPLALVELDYVIGNVQLKLGNFIVAEEKIQRSLKAFLQSDNKEFLNNIYLALTLLDSAKGNYKSAYENYKLYTFYTKIKTDQEIIRKSEGFKMRSQFEKKETELKLLSTENKLQTIITKKQQQKKNFAYAGIDFILLAGSYGFYRFRKRKQMQSQQELNNERFRISTELHDEVGATLSGIAMYSHLAKEQIQNSKAGEIENSINIIQSNASEMVNKLNDIVWLINPGQDSLQKLMQRLEDYAIQIAAVKNIRVKSNINGHHSANILPPETRRNIYLLFKEAINNAIKYSNAALLEICVEEKQGSVEISLKDDGDGFDIEKVNRGNGLNNMQKRAEEINGVLNITSQPWEGCVISLKVKIT